MFKFELFNHLQYTSVLDMKIFLASCTSSHSIQHDNSVAHIRNTLELEGHSVYQYTYDVDLLNDTRSFSELSNFILDCDLYIAEMSFPSQTLGFQIAYALSSTKPCLYLYRSDTQGRPDAPLANHPSRLLKVLSYTDDDLTDRINYFLQYALNQMNTKRTSFMSTQAIDRYLDDRSKSMGANKSELIRQILNDSVENANQGINHSK